MSLQETAGTVTGIKYVKVDSASIPEDVSVWAVVEKETGRERGFVASAHHPYEPNSNQMYHPVKWGFAVRKDEFASGITFPYVARAHASLSLMNKR